VLVEHKSEPDRWAALHLLRYIIGVWSRLKEDKELDRKHLPEIVPVLLYHARQRWRRPPEFRSTGPLQTNNGSDDNRTVTERQCQSPDASSGGILSL
jgi:hypothetical protein